MDLVNDLAGGMLSGLGYALVGIILLVLGYKVIDWVTPGNLATLIYAERNRNAAMLVASGLVGIGAIVTTAIATSDDNFARGLGSAAGYGLLGILLLGLSFRVVDRFTPGDLGVICTDPNPHPAVWVTAATQLVMGAVLAAAIS